MSLRQFIFLIFILMGLTACGEVYQEDKVLEPSKTVAIQLPHAQQPVQLSESMLQQLEAIPIAEGKIPANACIAIVRQASIPIAVDGAVAFTDYGWHIGVECARQPGKRCFPVDDGHCICYDAVPDGAGGAAAADPEGVPLVDPPPAPCRMVFDTSAISDYVSRIRRVTCEGDCIDSGQRCGLRRLPSYKPKVADYMLGCACVDRHKPKVELIEPAW